MYIVGYKLITIALLQQDSDNWQIFFFFENSDESSFFFTSTTEAGDGEADRHKLGLCVVENIKLSLFALYNNDFNFIENIKLSWSLFALYISSYRSVCFIGLKHKMSSLSLSLFALLCHHKSCLGAHINSLTHSIQPNDLPSRSLDRDQ